MTVLWYMPRSGNGARRHASLRRLWWAALLSLAMLVGLPPDAEAQNSPTILQYKTSHTFSRIAAVDMTARCVGDTSQPLTVSSRVEGKPDNPSLHRSNAADDGDFELFKTTQSLTLAARSTDAPSINIQTIHAAAHELEERFEVVASGNPGAAAFDAGLDGKFIEDGPPTVDRAHTDPFRIEESDTGTVTFSTSFPLPHPVNVRHSFKSRQRTFTETVGVVATTVADHNMVRGTVTIPADGDTARLDAQIVPESREQFVIEHYGPSTTPDYRPFSTFTTLGEAKDVVVVAMADDDTPKSSQRLVHLHGSEIHTGSSRRMSRERSSATLTVTRVGDAPVSDLYFSLMYTEFPASEAIWDDDRIRAFATIRSGQQSSFVPLQITDNTIDDRCCAFSNIEIDDASGCWRIGADHRPFEGLMQGNDKTPANLPNASTTAWMAVSNARGASCQLARRPKANAMAMEQSAGVSTNKGVAGVSG